MRHRGRTLTAVIVTGGLLAAGCGGSSRHATAPGALGTLTAPRADLATGATSSPPPATAAFVRRASLITSAADSAGTAQNYVPTGPIVADDGFRPTINGFAFENYGNDAGPVNLTPANVEHLFGPDVCAVGTGATCVLTASAQTWMHQENVAMAEGHCMGFSVSALRFFTGNLSPSTFGAASPVALPIVGNDPLQELIAEDFAYQDLPSVRRHIIGGTPDEVLQALISALKTKRQTYTLAILKADGTGGHAVTPFAVENHAPGIFRILVYDNNFPGITRAVDVNTVQDTWSYVGGVNPSQRDEVYTGDARTQNMGLLPTDPGEGIQPCPFCGAGDRSGRGVSNVPARTSYVQVGLTTSGTEHPHLLFEDQKTGLKTGYENGRLLQEIPGILVDLNYSVKTWSAAPEPSFDLPLQHPPYKVFIDGSDLTRRTTATITINGTGVVYEVSDIHMAPGQVDEMVLPSANTGVTYASSAKSNITPVMSIRFSQFYRNAHGGSNHHHARAILVSTASFGYKPGSAFTLQLELHRNVVLYGSGSSTGGRVALLPRAKAPGGPRTLVVLDALDLPVRGGHRHEQEFIDKHVRFDPNHQLVVFDYFRQHPHGLPLVIANDALNRVIQRVVVPPLHHH